MRNDRRLVDFEFTVASDNATGKFFVCQDVIEACNDLIRNVWYWRLPMKTSSFHLPGPGRSRGSILAGPRGRIARRHSGVAFPDPPGRMGAAR